MTSRGALRGVRRGRMAGVRSAVSLRASLPRDRIRLLARRGRDARHRVRLALGQNPGREPLPLGDSLHLDGDQFDRLLHALESRARVEPERIAYTASRPETVDEDDEYRGHEEDQYPDPGIREAGDFDGRPLRDGRRLHGDRARLVALRP